MIESHQNESNTIQNDIFIGLIFLHCTQKDVSE